LPKIIDPFKLGANVADRSWQAAAGDLSFATDWFGR
jgi:hypothetical protein